MNRALALIAILGLAVAFHSMMRADQRALCERGDAVACP